MIAQDLWQTHYQILSIIFLTEFIELNVNKDTMIKNVRLVNIQYKYCDCFFKYVNFKDNLIEYKFLCCKRNYQHKFDKMLKGQIFNTYTNFLTTTLISLFYRCKKLFILMKKIQWNIITWKRRFLQSLKHERYYWYKKLPARKKNL